MFAEEILAGRLTLQPVQACPHPGEHHDTSQKNHPARHDPA
jgi:hypothetical protein